MTIYAMVDLETQGLQNDAVIASMGVVFYNTQSKEIINKFHIIVDIEDALSKGFTQDESTLDWWSKQSKEARRIFEKDVQEKEAYPLREVLIAYSRSVRDIKVKYGTVYQFGNSSMFDNMKIKTACEKLGVTYPFEHWEDLCYRTIKTMFGKGVTLDRKGTFHNALNDAESQMEHMVRIIEKVRGGYL